MTAKCHALKINFFCKKDLKMNTKTEIKWFPPETAARYMACVIGSIIGGAMVWAFMDSLGFYAIGEHLSFIGEIGGFIAIAAIPRWPRKKPA